MTSEEFSRIADSTGLKPGKLAELLGKTPQTLRLYRSGARNVPLLVAEKIAELDRLINGGATVPKRDYRNDVKRMELAKKIATAKAAGLPQLVARYQEELDNLN